MGIIIEARIDTPFGLINSHSDIIKFEEYQNHQQSQCILERARQQAKAIRDKAQEEMENAYASGYQEGLRKAGFAAHATQMSAQKKADELLVLSEQAVIDLVRSLVSKVLGDAPRVELIRGMVANGLDRLRGATRICVHIPVGSQGDCEYLLTDLKRQYDVLNTLEIKKDSSLNSDECRIESEHELIHYNLKECIAALSSVFCND